MRKAGNKTREDRAVRLNISLHPRLISELPALLRSRGYTGLSDYVQATIRRDAGLDSRQIAA